MLIKKFTAIILGKLIFHITQILKIGGGSAAPGYYALKIYPNLVKDLASKIPQTIIVTGTNGKTTTSRMLAQIAQTQGFKVIRNSTGSNLERGIASTLIANYELRAMSHDLDLAIWELDEAAFNSVALKLNPDIIVFLNIFRDQLDRYGEIDTVVSKWCQTLSKINPKTEIFINGDDHNLLELKKCFKGKTQTFGVLDYKISGEKIIHQKEQEKLDFEAKNIQPQGLDSINFSINSQEFNLPVPGIYHVYNFLAAYSCAMSLKIPVTVITQALKNYSPAFGRFEKLDFGYIFLIKNPAGATQIFQTIASEIKPQDRLLLALNDNLADGTDVSWIWDSQIELLRTTNNEQRTICSGSRAQDLALRLKYAGFDSQSIIIENNLEKAFREARAGLKGILFILPTYTALLELQSILVKQGLKNHYWEEKQ